jgi:sporulation protein YlmC with PRC-barrel domain
LVTVQLRVGARVRSSDDLLGKLDALIVDPTERRVTHLVVSDHLVAPRRLVPKARVMESTPDEVTLDVSRDEFESFEAFDEPDYNVPEDIASLGQLQIDPGFYYLEPYATPADGWLLSEHERVPKDEVALRRGVEVLSADGKHVGHVDEFLVDPQDGQVTHVVLRTGTLFKKRDVVVPVRRTSEFDDVALRLDLTVDELGELPRIPVKRHRHVGSPD